MLHCCHSCVWNLFPIDSHTVYCSKLKDDVPRYGDPCREYEYNPEIG